MRGQAVTFSTNDYLGTASCCCHAIILWMSEWCSSRFLPVHILNSKSCLLDTRQPLRGRLWLMWSWTGGAMLQIKATGLNEWPVCLITDVRCKWHIHDRHIYDLTAIDTAMRPASVIIVDQTRLLLVLPQLTSFTHNTKIQDVMWPHESATHWHYG